MEAINKIKLSEENAKQLINEAVSQKKVILKEAEKLSNEKYESIVKSAKAEKEDLISKALEAGEKEAAPIFENGKGEVTKILKTENSKISEAVNFIKKKVVNINGNS